MAYAGWLLAPYPCPFAPRPQAHRLMPHPTPHSCPFALTHSCAECLGLLGAIDPARVQPLLPRPEGIASEERDFLATLITKHLVSGVPLLPLPLVK